MSENIFYKIVQIVAVMLLVLLAACAIDPFISVNLLQVAFGLCLIGISVLLLLITLYPEDNKTTTNNNLNHIIQEGFSADSDDEAPSAITPKSAVEL